MQGNRDEFVANSTESRREADLEKRIDDLFKEVKDLSTLYGVEAAVVVKDLQENEYSFWPSQSDVKETVTKFLNIPEHERTQNLFTSENFLEKEINDYIENIKKLEMENDAKEMEHLFHEIMRDKNTIEKLDLKQTNGLIKLVQDKMERLDKRIEELDRDKVTEASGSATCASTPHPKLIEDQKIPSDTGADIGLPPTTDAARSVVGKN